MAARGAKVRGLLLVLGALLGLGAAAQEGSKRIIRGQVLDENDKVVHPALVHLKNVSTEEQWSVVTNKEGRYIFHDVDIKHDYEVYAEWREQRSRARRISQFDTRPLVRVNLKLRPADEPKEKQEKEEKDGEKDKEKD